jgi:hypothetical protein
VQRQAARREHLAVGASGSSSMRASKNSACCLTEDEALSAIRKGSWQSHRSVALLNVRHDVLLGKTARRVQDPKVLHLVKLIIKADGKKGVPQGGPFSPLAANIYLNEVDWYFDDLSPQDGGRAL